MILIIDIGNTNIKFALSSDGDITKVERLDGEYSSDTAQSILDRLVASKKPDGAIISSVVPLLTKPVRLLATKLTGTPPLVIEPTVFSCLPIKIPKSAINEIGSDIVCNAVAAHALFPNKGTIVTDFGTAMASVATGPDGTVLGVAITPGIGTAIKSLSTNTALLPKISLATPTTSLGTDTITAIQSGVIFGYKGMAASILHQMRQDMLPIIKVTDIATIATGGVSSAATFIPEIYDVIDPLLTLKGAALCFDAITS